MDGIEYTVRHNYLHRGNSRLVLEHKIEGKHCFIQFDFRSSQLEYNKEVHAFFCYGSKYEDKQITVLQ